jgi:hypothetical protein
MKFALVKNPSGREASRTSRLRIFDIKVIILTAEADDNLKRKCHIGSF